MHLVATFVAACGHGALMEHLVVCRMVVHAMICFATATKPTFAEVGKAVAKGAAVALVPAALTMWAALVQDRMGIFASFFLAVVEKVAQSISLRVECERLSGKCRCSRCWCGRHGPGSTDG